MVTNYFIVFITYLSFFKTFEFQCDIVNSKWAVRPLPRDETWTGDIAKAVVECCVFGMIPDVDFPDKGNFLQKKIPPMSKVK